MKPLVKNSGAIVALSLIAAPAHASISIPTEMFQTSFILLAAFITAYIAVSVLSDFSVRVRAIAAAACVLSGTVVYAQAVDLNKNSTPIVAVASTGATSDVPRESDGHFRAATIINGHAVEMLVDTGASVVLLTYKDALLAGIDIGALNFNVPVLTANGRSHVATFTVDEIAVGSVIVKNIRGAVAEKGQLHASLLGMSFLGAIEEAVIRKDRLILRN